MDLILMIVAFGAIMYFLMIRPQQKRVKEHQALINALEPGARVLLTSGMFGTIRHLGERQAIIELAPGAEVTTLKGNIARVAAADEEEFEFSDDVDVVAEVDVDDLSGFSADGLEPSHFTQTDADPVGEFDPRPVDPDSDDNRKHDN